MRRQLLRCHRQVRISQEFLDAAVPRFKILDDGIDLNPVAGRQENAFLDSLIRAQSSQGFSEAAFGNSQFFPDFHGCGFMAESDNDDMHRRPEPYLEARRMMKKLFQQGRSERRPEACFSRYVEGLSDARTQVESFCVILMRPTRSF